MKGAPTRDIVSGPSDDPRRRTVPGPRSKAVFAREAEVMAPGLQSIALYSQIAVDRAKGCTIYDVDGNEYLDFIAGIAVGLVMALAGSRVIGSLLYGVSPRDPAVFSGTALLLLGVALLACWLPARRAARLSPLQALRTDS